MFEAIVMACLALSPDVCRAQLLPGFEAAELDTCAAALEARPPVLPHDPRLIYAAAPVCVAAGPALSVAEIAPGIFVHLGQVAHPDAENLGDVANVGFVIGTKSVAVIDTGGARWMGEALWRSIRQRTDLPVSHVILTHMHPDHVLGIAAFTGTGARVVAHAALPRALADREANYVESFEALIGPEAMVGTRTLPADITVSEALAIDLGGRSLRVEAWPMAHTGNDITVLDSATSILFAGDLVFDRHTPALDGSLRGWLAALDRMADLEVGQVVPGHGGPVLDWPDGAAAQRRYLDVLANDTRAAIDEGTRLGEAVENIAASEAETWELFETYNPRNATVAFTELEWE